MLTFYWTRAVGGGGTLKAVRAAVTKLNIGARNSYFVHRRLPVWLPFIHTKFYIYRTCVCVRVRGLPCDYDVAALSLFLACVYLCSVQRDRLCLAHAFDNRSILHD